MAQHRLTQKTVEAAACPPGKKDTLIFDRDMPGFGLRVGSNGSKTFLVQYSAPAGKRRLSLGAFGILTPDEARKRAKIELGKVAEGRDPFSERQAAAEAQRADIAAEKVKEAVEALTVGKLIDAWEKARQEERRASYTAIASASLRRHFKPWADRAASGITTAEAVLALDRIKEDAGPVAANRALAYGRAAYGWAARRQMVASNPFVGVEAPSRERSRDRVLSAAEVGAIWRAADKLPHPYGGFTRTLLLTLQRREEVAGMRWDELDDAKEPTVWTLPGERAKNGKAHVVHLSEPVRAILKAMPRTKPLDGAPCPFVFAAESGNPVSAFSFAKRRLDAAIMAEREKAAAEAGEEAEAPAGWVLHDFRRAGVTELAGLGVAPHIADKLLNHVSGAIQGVAAVYQRAEFLSERKAALDAWATFVLSAAKAPSEAETVPQEAYDETITAYTYA